MRFLLLALPLFLSLLGCSTLDALNPFGSSAPKMAKLEAITPSVNPRVVWQERIGKSGDYALMPGLEYGAVYAAARNGDLMRIDDGKVAWRVNAEQSVSGGVGVGANLVVVGSLKGDVLAFDNRDGKKLWNAKVSSEIIAPPTVGAGLVIVRSGDNTLTAFDAINGVRKWVFQRPTTSLSLRTMVPPIVDERYLVAGFPAGKLIVLNVANGAALWEGAVALPKGVTELDRIADITSMPVMAGDAICAVAYQGRVSCFDMRNGSLIWTRDMSSAVGLTIDGRALFVTDDKGAIHALDMVSGTSLWKQDKLFLRRVSAPAVLRGRVIVADVEGVLHVLDRNDGSFIGRLTTDGSAIIAPLQVRDNRLIVQTSAGGIFAIEIE